MYHRSAHAACRFAYLPRSTCSGRKPPPVPFPQTFAMPDELTLDYLNGLDVAALALTDDWESCVRGADIVVEASRGASRDARTTARRSCCGTAGCRPPTSRSAPRCSTRRSGWGSDSGCGMRDPAARSAGRAGAAS
jgi:hypothetical protein